MGAKLLHVLMITLLSITLISCGETDEEKLEKKADNLVEEYNDLADDLSNNNPDLSWSDDELDSYLIKVNRLESVYDELIQLDADNYNLTIYGGHNTNWFVSYRRTLANAVKAEKALLKIEEEEKRKRLGILTTQLSGDEAQLQKVISEATVFLDEMYAEDSADDLALKNDIATLEEYSQSLEGLLSKITDNPKVEMWSDKVLFKIKLISEANDILDLIEAELKLKRAKILQNTI